MHNGSVVQRPIGRPPGRMTQRDYEQRYAEALDVVRRKISNVGQPETMPDGTRLVRVGAMRCDDEFVFRLAWGKETARDIVDQRPASRR